MKRLAERDLLGRRTFDWQVVQRMNEPPTYVFTAHRTPQDAAKGLRPIDNEDDARFAIHYRAEYHVRTLAGEDRFATLTVLRVDVLGARYPYEGPVGWVVKTSESKTPWSPHFARGLPVCNGSVWRSDGQVLLAHYLVHLARLLNWDERLPSGYGGYNPAAISWWRKHRNKPLDPVLRYPKLAAELLYGEAAGSEESGFRARGRSAVRPAQAGFRKIG